jgi:hypothetical protein
MLSIDIEEDVFTLLGLITFTPCAILSLIMGLTDTSDGNLVGWTFVANGAADTGMVLALFCTRSKCTRYIAALSVAATGLVGTILLERLSSHDGPAFEIYMFTITLQTVGLLCLSVAHWHDGIKREDDITQTAVIVEIPVASAILVIEELPSQTPIAEQAAVARTFYDDES